MSRRRVYPKEVRIRACEDYLSGRKTLREINGEIAPGKFLIENIRRWINEYRAKGPEAFDDRPKNRSYTNEFKEKVVKEYLDGEGSLNSLAIKYDIPSMTTLSAWVKKYNGHIELKDYDPKGDIYMAKAKKTTYEERLEAVRWCLDHERSISDTAAHFGLTYAQVRYWVIKYEELGEEGLVDKRGKRKTDEELTELELANRKIQRLERENEAFKRRYELLKKVMEKERW